MVVDCGDQSVETDADEGVALLRAFALEETDTGVLLQCRLEFMDEVWRSNYRTGPGASVYLSHRPIMVWAYKVRRLFLLSISVLKLMLSFNGIQGGRMAE